MKFDQFFVSELLLLLIVSIVSSSSSPYSITTSISAAGTVNYSISTQQASRLIGVKFGAHWHTFQAMDGWFPTIAEKRPIMDYLVNNLGVQMIIIIYKRLPSWWVPGVDQLESPVNSGQLNPKVLHHLDEWVQLAREFSVKIFLEDWFSPMRATQRGEWHGFDDWTFHEYWASFYKSLAAHYKGENAIAGFIPGEEVVVNDTWPYTESGSKEFNDLWNSVMTKLSVAIHEVDPDRNFVSPTTVDWSGGIYTLGSKAMYPNAWQPLNDPNPHVLYRVLWNPQNEIKTGSQYPLDTGILNGAINWHQETGLPVMIEVFVEWGETATGRVWIWDEAGLQWLRDLLSTFRQKGVGGDIGEYDNDTAPYFTHNPDWTEKIWVPVLRDFLISL